MSDFRKVLVYAEVADPACLDPVIERVARQGGTLTICDVIAPAPRLPDPDGQLQRLQTLSWQQALERLRRLCAPYLGRVELDYTVLVGNPFVAITEQVVQQHFDLVVHISDPVDGRSTIGLNPTGMHLMRKCPCAVWSMHAGAPRRLDSLVLAIDRDMLSAGPHGAPLALELLGAACAVATPGARVHVVHAWEPFAAALLDDERAGFTAAEAGAYLDGMECDYAAWFADLLARLRTAAPQLEFVPHLVRGKAATAVPRLAVETGAGLVIMGTIGSSNVPGMLIGTTTEAILSGTAAPVLAVKPRGFRTPLRLAAGGSGYAGTVSAAPASAAQEQPVHHASAQQRPAQGGL